jgi:hypothetical protein
MVIGTWLASHNVPTIILSIVLAFVFGYALTMRGVLKSGMDLKRAFRIALAAVTVPVNKWMIGRGRGHAVVHAHHH